MSLKTIAEFLVFLIILAWCAGCNLSSSAPAPDPHSPYATPVQIGTIKSPDITEASGLAASRCQPDVLWTHNDSGDDAYVYALKPTGESLGTWRIPDAHN